MKPVIFTFNFEYDLDRNAATLRKVLVDERAGHACQGYRLIFNAAEVVTHKRDCPALLNSCWDFVRMARDSRAAYKVFRNMNGEIAVAPLDSSFTR